MTARPGPGPARPADGGAVPSLWVWASALAVVLAAGSWLWNRDIAPTAMKRYLADRAAALDTGEPVTDELLTALVRDKLAVQAGADLFSRNCSKCHGARAEGGIGPNLTDEFWIAGAAPTDIHRTILLGRGGKGMPAWGLQLGTGAVQQLAAFVLTLRDTNVPGGKAPQGERTAAAQASTPSPR